MPLIHTFPFINIMTQETQRKNIETDPDFCTEYYKGLDCNKFLIIIMLNMFSANIHSKHIQTGVTE